MRQHDDPRAGRSEPGDGRQHALEPGCVGDDAILDRHVEIGADEDAFAPHVDALDGLDARKVETRIETGSRFSGRDPLRLVHMSRPMATAVSLMRLEKPHSLSYQATTRQNVSSTTCVPVRSKIELNGSWLKSLETSGFAFTPRMPLSGPLAALITAWLISSAVVGRADWKVRSTRLTFGTGTLIEAPSSLPLSSGRTRPTAFAAPVELGIRLMALARAR